MEDTLNGKKVWPPIPKKVFKPKNHLTLYWPFKIGKFIYDLWLSLFLFDSLWLSSPHLLFSFFSKKSLLSCHGKVLYFTSMTKPFMSWPVSDIFTVISIIIFFSINIHVFFPARVPPPSSFLQCQVLTLSSHFTSFSRITAPLPANKSNFSLFMLTKKISPFLLDYKGMYTVCTVHYLGICQVSQNKGENSKTLYNDEKMKGRLNIYKLCRRSVPNFLPDLYNVVRLFPYV